MVIRLESGREALAGFRYFWGKTVDGFNNKHHCAKCLSGEYAAAVNEKLPANQDIFLDYPEGQVFYICGVSDPYKWKNNAHLAVKVKDGASASVQLYNGDTLTVTGAEQILFDGKKAFERYPDLGKAYTTCRNFQFGVHYFEE